jgi:hypothetical protein
VVIFKKPVPGIMRIRGLLGGAHDLFVSSLPVRTARTFFDGPMVRRVSLLAGLLVASFMLRVLPGRWIEEREIVSSFMPLFVAALIMKGTLELGGGK